MKKLGFLTLLITAALLLTLAFPAAATGPKTPAAPLAVPARAAAPGATHGPGAPRPPSAAAPAATQEPGGPRPRVHEAIEAMRNAREHLQQAQGNFHGHREKAIEHLNAAIHEAEICEHER